MKQTDAVVVALAGSVEGDLAPMAPQGRKCMIPINGRPAAAYLVENLRRCELVSKVIVVSDEADCAAALGADSFIHANGELADCVIAGMGEVESARCLVMGGDMPLASADAIGDLLTCAPDSDVVYPIVGRTDVLEVFPERKAFYVETKEGHYTGSSCLLFNPAIVKSREALLTRLLAAKSNPKELLSLVGPGLAMKFMLTKLALREFEEHLSRVLDLSCRVFITHFPEMLMSIDTAGDVRLIEKELSATY